MPRRKRKNIGNSRDDFRGFIIVSREGRSQMGRRRPFDILYYTRDMKKQYNECVECLSVTQRDVYLGEDIVYHKWFKKSYSWFSISAIGEKVVKSLIKKLQFS